MGHRDGVPASTIPLLQTKLFPPGAGGLPLLPRQALIDRLYEARGRRAMVLSAPAGFGKSTILCQLRLRLLEQGAAVAWLSCDETDSEPQRLIQYLLASIQRVVPAFGGNTANLLGTDVAVPLEGILDAFLADLRRLEGPLYLFLDDFHRIRHAALPHGVRYLIENLPDHVRVVASTRFRPRFLVDEPTLKPWTFCLSAEDLRLSREESDAFLLDLKGLELGERELKLLFKRTEGWITALHLAALALSRNTDREGFLRGLSGTERNIADYLAEDVLASLPADLQLFLDQTSVLDEFNAELCNALLGDYAEAAGAIGSAREDLKVADSEYLQVVTSLIESLICKESGDLERGRAIAESARNRVEQVFGRRSRVGGPLSLAYADLLYEQDRHAGVLAELPLATVWRDVATPVELLSRGQLVMAKARFFSGAAEQGLAQLDEWLSGLLSPGYERVYAHAMSCKVQFLLWLRRPNEAERVCLQLERHLAGLSGERHADAQTALVLAEARLALSERHAERAQSKLESCLAGYSSAYQRDRRLRLSLLLSVAYWQKGNSEKAIGLFLATLEEAWNLGYRRLFQDDALWLLPMWESWREAEPKRAAAWQGLADLLREQCRKLSVDPESFDENQDVSHREREILRLVAAGLSNRDIAQAVHLSEATIKWHLHNLFAKLGVKSRTQAVLKGKSLGLLSEA
ncbi:LuxR C-terminal-related transcriptional regulator [Pseudomonas aeruginosa]|uniref:LuxR C-terminal-related transcriptional regulator n=1 Tax=Pseudomonas aeruginosa TaxID=287 RepID=UPI001069252E|nr:LuxR C-terminal-related transcriptional regulator [Pseudomonas aeruginosa]